jgi:hypothetical protein
VGADWTRSKCGLARTAEAAVRTPRHGLVHVGLQTMTSPLRVDGDVLCKLPLRHFYQGDIHRDELSRPHPPGLTPFPYLTSPGVQLRPRWAAGCRSCKPQHVPPHSHILTCHLILCITLMPLLRAYTYVLWYSKCPVHPPRSAWDLDGHLPLEDLPRRYIRSSFAGKPKTPCRISTAIAGERAYNLKLPTTGTAEVRLYVHTSSPVIITPKAPSPQGAHHKGIEPSVSGKTKSEADREKDRYVCTTNRPLFP